MNATVLVFAAMFGVGFVLSIVMSTLQCSKRAYTISMQEGLFFSGLVTGVHWIASSYSAVRLPFARVMMMFGTAPEKAETMGIGYLMMLMSWVGITRMYHSTEVEVCKPSVDEMAKVKADLMKKLAQKEDEQEANEKKPTS